jgi:hypothetical protein
MEQEQRSIRPAAGDARPANLLKRVDQRAGVLRTSRNRVILSLARSPPRKPTSLSVHDASKAIDF